MRTRARLKAKHWRRDTRRSCGRCFLCRMGGRGDLLKLQERVRDLEDRVEHTESREERIARRAAMIDRALGIEP